MSEIWIVASAHGGEGKTFVTAQLGRALARMGKRAALVDLNIGFGQLDIALGLEHAIVYHLLDVATGVCRLSQALVREGQAGPSLLAAPTNEIRALSADALNDILDKLTQRFDYVLMDGPTGFPDVLFAAAGRAERGILVCGPERPVRGIRFLESLLKKEGVSRIGVVCNFAKKPSADIAESGAELLGAIPKGAGDAEFDRLVSGILGDGTVKVAGVKRRVNAVKRFQSWLDGSPV